MRAVVAAMDNGSKRVSDGTEIANRAGTALQQIQQSVSDIVLQVQQVYGSANEMLETSTGVVRMMETVSSVTEQTTAATEEMAASSTEVSGQVEQVAAISEQSVASAEEVSAAMQQQSASAEELTASVEELAGMAQQLLWMIAQFRTGADHQYAGTDTLVPGTATDRRLRAA